MNILVTGCAGQDGILLSRELVTAGHRVFGAVRSQSIHYLKQANPGVNCYPIDLMKASPLAIMLDEIKPDWIINLAGFSSVAGSFQHEAESYDLNFHLVQRIVNWILVTSPKTKLLQASSSEIFGGGSASPQTEDTQINPATPYGNSKALAHEFIIDTISNGTLDARIAILYNHESPLRKPEFVTRHLSRSIAKFSLGMQESISIGNLDAMRDWGWAPDYARAMQKMLDTKPGEVVMLATGHRNSVKDFLEACLSSVNLKLSDVPLNVNIDTNRKVDPMTLVGTPTKAFQLGLLEHTRDITEIAKSMVNYDIHALTEGYPEIWWESDETN